MTPGQPSAEQLHIVLARRGEFSEREEWVCGVFTDAERAQDIAVAKLRECREAEGRAMAWDRLLHAEIARVSGEVSRPLNDIAGALSPTRRAEFVQAHGERPEVEADAFWVVSLPLDALGRWGATFHAGDAT